MNKLYNSELFEKIQDPLTGLYKESPAYVYCLLEDEFKFGRIVQQRYKNKLILYTIIIKKKKNETKTF